MITIELEDKGQDLLRLKLNDSGVVQSTEPYFTEIYKGAIIPINQGMLKVGEQCPIHHPPHIVFGFLKYNVKSIESTGEKIDEL